ncbi:enoyl-CoA hydratase [Leptospira sp. severe_002]|uniref:enoyl-CoA hydratase n=1 Tax=Leptospira sp. severe_002 TaxID=2838237 RepID=UPI001E38E136|nr:enoyl-CoA hydratase [Leptospira sp. severe_002]
MSKAADAIAKAENKMQMKKEGRVGYVIYNNPERHNAVSLDMWEAAVAILDEYRDDKDVSVVVVTGAGGKAFVSGADISKFEKERSDEASVARYGKMVEASYNAFHTFPKPTIAMIRGYCIGGGMGLATCCDLRIATEGSKFGVPAAKLGLGYGYPGLKRLVDIVGPSFAMEIFYTARQFTAAEAVTMGLVNRVVADGELEKYVSDYAAVIAGNAPLTIKAVKATVAEVMREDSKRDIKLTQDLVDACFKSNDYQEGRKAFMEKRKPVFTGT